MKKFVWFLLLFMSCKSNVHTYNFKQLNFSFSMEEKEKEDILVIEKTDSIFFPNYDGQYTSVVFYLSEKSDSILLDSITASEMHRYVKNKYKICILTQEKQNSYNYWKFIGGCDQGRYTFSVFHNNKWLGPSLEPLEWKE